MHVLYKLVALSVVFGVVLTSPAPTLEEPNEEFMQDGSNVPQDQSVDGGSTLDIEQLLPGLKWLPVLIKLAPSILTIKTKALGIAAMIFKWLAPKTILLAIGAIATFTFCKLSNLCSVAYDPVVYNYVPSEYRNLVTPERLEDAQRYLTSALQQYEYYKRR